MLIFLDRWGRLIENDPNCGFCLYFVYKNSSEFKQEIIMNWDNEYKTEAERNYWNGKLPTALGF